MATANSIDANSSGIMVYNGSGTFSGRTITGTTNQISVSNGNGISGNPTLSLSNQVVITTQPCMSAFLNATVNNVTGNGTQYTVLFNTVIFDQGSNYNSGTGVFTAPIAGRYLVTAQCEFTNVGTSVFIAETYLFTTSVQWRGAANGPANSASSTTKRAAMNGIIDMALNDTFTVVVIVTGQGADTVGVAGGATNPRSFLCCKLIL